MTTDWTQAACATKDPTEWDRETEYAYHHCQVCPLMAHCLQQSLLPEIEGGSKTGMRGGWTEAQRKYFKKHGKIPRPINWQRVEAGKSQPSRGGRLSNTENQRRLALYEQGLSDEAIAAAVGVASTAIESWRRIRKLPINNLRRGPLTAEDEQDRYRAWEIGLTDQQAAKLLKCSTHSFRMWRRRKELKVNSKVVA